MGQFRSVKETEADIRRYVKQHHVRRLEAAVRHYAHWYPESVHFELKQGDLVRFAPNHYYRIDGTPDELFKTLVDEGVLRVGLNRYFPMGGKDEVRASVCKHGKDDRGRCIAPFSTTIRDRVGTCLTVAVSEQLINQAICRKSWLVTGYAEGDSSIPGTRQWGYHTFNILPKEKMLDDVAIADTGTLQHAFPLDGFEVTTELDMRPGILLRPARNDRRRYFLPCELSYIKKYLVRELK